MMKYLLKRTMVATDANDKQPGVTIVTYEGKKNAMCSNVLYLDAQGNMTDKWGNIVTLPVHPYFFRQYGYSREGDVKRNWCYKNVRDEDMWTTTFDVVSLDV